MRNALRSKAVDLSAVVVDLSPWSFGPPKGMTLLQQGADCYATLGEKHFHGRSAELQIPPLRYPGFPVEVDGVDEVHAALFAESRTRGLVQFNVAGNPGTLRSG